MPSEHESFLRRLFNTACVAVWAAGERRAPFRTPEQIAALQARRLRSIVRHAYRTVPFYRREIDRLGLRPEDFKSVADLEALPLLDDLTVRRDVDQFVSRRHADGPRLALRTSGAYSRVRKLIYVTHADALRRMAHAERDRAVLNRLLGTGWGQVQLFLLSAASISILSRRFWDRQLLAPRGLARRHFLSSEVPLADAAAAINDFRPQVVFSYGSYADEFIRYADDRRLELALPRVWMYGGDMLSQTGRELIEQRGCMVYSTYQSVETGRLGFQCERREGFHLNTDLCAVRLVDAAGRTVPPGQPGEVVISNLVNRAMVLLNYRLGDMGVMATQPCPCGRGLPLLAELQGKVNAIICLPDGRRIIGGILELMLKEELKDSLQAQAVQSSPRQMLWRIVPLSGADREGLRRRLLDKTRSIIGQGLEIEVQFVERIPRTPTGKFLRVLPLSGGPDPPSAQAGN